MLKRILPPLLPIFLIACTGAPLPPAQNAAPAPAAPAPAAPSGAAAEAVKMHGLVSAADPRAADAGVQILRRGGNATDAAIATMLALTVVEPQSSGIGGGGFYVRGNSAGEVETIDGREMAPAAAMPEWFLGEDGKPLAFRDAVMSGLSVGVPGNLQLAEFAHRRHGRLEWAALFQPAIKLAEEGWTITPRFHQYLGMFKDRAAFRPDGLSLYYDAKGEPFPVGTLLRNPQLAASLRAVAAAGSDAFYKGELADQIASTVAEATPHENGMTSADLAAYQAKQRDPVCGTYRRYRICGMGPPSSGATTIIAILKQLERFDLNALGPDSITFWHIFAESQRLAYADRELYLADSDFVQVPVKWLTSAPYLADRSHLIDPQHALESVKAGIPATPLSAKLGARADGDEPVEHGTSHFVTIDRWGNAVSYTSTIEGPFGSGLMAGGFYLNNELTDFSRVPEKNGVLVANRVEGSKRPRSSMSPTLVYSPDGTLIYAVGAAGGGTIPVQVAKTLIGLIDFQLSLEDSLALPQLYAPGPVIVLEEGSKLADRADEFTALGHKKVIAHRLPLKANAAAYKDGVWHGAGDPRSEGVAIHE